MKKILKFSFILIIVLGGAYYWNQTQGNSPVPNPLAPKQVKTKFAVLSDTHSDSENTRKALQLAKANGAEFVMGTGDLTTVGSVKELTEAKEDFDQSGLEYFVIPGDHDLYSSAGFSNFEKVFGRPYYVTDKESVRLLSLDTSDTNLGINDTQMDFFRKELASDSGKPVFIFMHLPIYHPTSPRTIWEKGGNNQLVKEQAEKVISLLKGSSVVAVFAGDHHLSSDYTEPQSGVKMYIVGAVTQERNLQKPRFNMVTVYEDNTFNVEEIVID